MVRSAKFAALRYVLALLFPPVFLTTSLSAQELLFERRGGTSLEFQRAPVGLPDLDGDGVLEFAIGGYGEDGGSVDAGAIHIISGKTFAEIAVLYGENQGDALYVQARLPDVDADGIDDFVASALETDYAGPDTGSVYVYSGRSLALLKRLDGEINVIRFGSVCGGMGDLDGDGRGDLFVTDPYGAAGLGRIYVYSSASWAPLYTLIGNRVDTAFGQVASSTGDVDQDGALDLLVGDYLAKSSGKDWSGKVFVYSGRTGSLLRTYPGEAEYDEFGEACLDTGDVNGDGVHDHLLLSKHGGITGGGGLRDPAAAYVHSGYDGALLRKYEIPVDSEFTMSWHSIGTPGDVTGDGVSDFLLGGIYLASGRAFPVTLVHSGNTLEHLYTLRSLGSDLQLLEARYAPLGDLDRDGLSDLSMNAYTTDWANYARIHSGSRLWLKLNRFDVSEGDSLQMSVGEGMPGAPALIALMEVDSVPTFFAVGGLGRFDAKGVWGLSVTVPPGLAGHALTLQAFGSNGAGGVLVTTREDLRLR